MSGFEGAGRMGDGAAEADERGEGAERGESCLGFVKREVGLAGLVGLAGFFEGLGRAFRALGAVGGLLLL